MTDDLRVLVAQNGSRHNYAIPAVLGRASLLERFYTDACGNVGLGRALSLARFLPGVGGALRRLHHRRVPAEIVSRTRSFVLSSVADQLLPHPQGLPDSHRLVAEAMRWQGFGRANLVYSSMGWGRPFCRVARRRKIPVVAEVYVRLTHRRVHQAEYRAFPSWESSLPDPGYANDSLSENQFESYADFLVVPSEAVRQDIVEVEGFPRDRIKVVPYGVGEEFFAIKNQPVPGRVLYVGSCNLAKGIHRYAMAADSLRRRSSADSPEGIGFDFRAAGHASDAVRNQPECRAVNFLGRVPRSQIDKEYSACDVLVFPTLSDSFGMVMLEAMAAGVPVVCSPYCAEVVEDGISGFVVEPGNVTLLAERIARLVADRDLRHRMGVAARERAKSFTWEKYGETLISTLQACRRAV